MCLSLSRVAFARKLSTKSGGMAAVARQCPHFAAEGKEGASKR
jgi:hypothetical protein